MDVTTVSGDIFTGLLTHADLEQAVGDALASFVAQMVRGMKGDMNLDPFVRYSSLV